MGFESLARLTIEELGNISPIEFIDIAEKRMLIYDLGKQILRKACEFLKKIHDMGYEEVKVSVNISVIQLSEFHNYIFYDDSNECFLNC